MRRIRGFFSARLLDAHLRLPIEAAVSEHYAAVWRVSDFTDLHDRASHPAAILTDGVHPVFVKLSMAAHALDQFEAETAGLRLLAERARILTPPPINVIPLDGAALLILEAVQAVEPSSETWAEMGRTLARIHMVKGEQFGLDRHNYFGPFYQDNRPAPDWLTFFIERRVWPRFTGAIDSGHLSSETIHRVEQVIQRIPKLDLPDTAPILLHGDAQKNNFISTRAGAAAVDPAVYYGHPEMDLSYLDVFEPAPPEIYAGYQELRGIEPGFERRRALWRLPAYLALIAAAGSEYLKILDKVVRQYI